MITPLKDKLIIERDKAATHTESGLVIPEGAQAKELTGTIIAVGADVDADLVVGSRVLFGKVDGVAIDSKYIGRDGDFILVKDEQIRCILT